MRTFLSVLIVMLVAATLLVAGCSKRAARSAWTSSASIVIEPGISIGPIRAGMTIQQVIAELGEPERRTGSRLEYLNLGLSVFPGGKEGLVHIVLCVDFSGQGEPDAKAFAGHTKEGIGLGSSRADIIRAYGEPSTTDTVDGKPGAEILKFKPLGLYYRLRDGKVNAIGVIFRPQQ